MNLQEVSDRLEIAELIARYAHALDQRNWAGLESLFTPDAVLDFSSIGDGISGPERWRNRDANWSMSTSSLLVFANHIHANSIITLNGDDAEAVTELIGSTVRKQADGYPGTIQAEWTQLGGWYEDTFRRGNSGWRFSSRKLVSKYRVHVAAHLNTVYLNEGAWAPEMTTLPTGRGHCGIC
jgi:hypothetical protein